MLNVIAVRHLREHVLWLRFNDGSEGEVDLSSELDGPIFEPLRDVGLSCARSSGRTERTSRLSSCTSRCKPPKPCK